MSITTILYICISLSALISVVVWLDYFRKIDVFEPEKIRYLIVALLIGSATPFISLEVYALFDYLNFKENGELLNDLIYSIFGIGLNEELSKIVGVVVAFYVLKKRINESIDYLIFAGMVAIGFALVENFMYIERYGIDIITTRSFYSVLEHIINTSIITYGFFRCKIFKKGNQILNTTLGFIVAICSHGLFDFFIVNPHFSYLSPVLVITVYLIGINFWISMLNNTINYSNQFNYAQIQYSNKILYRLIVWYFFTMLIGLLYKIYASGIYDAIASSLFNVFAHGFLFIIVILRASRFKIYLNYYQPITISLPFYITKNNDEDFKVFNLLPIKIRGENAFEYFLTKHIGKPIEVISLNAKKSFFKKPMKAIIADKIFLENETTVYLIEFINYQTQNHFYLKPKTRDKTLINSEYPINSLLFDPTPNIKPQSLKELKFIEWVFVKIEDDVTSVNY